MRDRSQTSCPHNTIAAAVILLLLISANQAFAQANLLPDATPEGWDAAHKSDQGKTADKPDGKSGANTMSKGSSYGSGGPDTGRRGLEDGSGQLGSGTKP